MPFVAVFFYSDKESMNFSQEELWFDCINTTDSFKLSVSYTNPSTFLALLLLQQNRLTAEKSICSSDNHSQPVLFNWPYKWIFSLLTREFPNDSLFFFTIK